MIESNGPRLRTSTKRGCGLPASQILGEVARHDVRCDSRSRSSQPQPAPRFLDPRLRILAAEAFQKCFDGWLSAIPRGYFSRHTAWPRNLLGLWRGVVRGLS